jgi:hypothetical protein
MMVMCSISVRDFMAKCGTLEKEKSKREKGFYLFGGPELSHYTTIFSLRSFHSHDSLYVIPFYSFHSIILYVILSPYRGLAQDFEPAEVGKSHLWLDGGRIS